MKVYARFGAEVNITEARMIPVWIVKTTGRIKWHYSKPKPRKGATVELMPMWHYRGTYADNGQKVCDGKWVPINDLNCDGGWLELDKLLKSLSPDSNEAFKVWNKAGGPDADELFQTISEKEAA